MSLCSNFVAFLTGSEIQKCHSRHHRSGKSSSPTHNNYSTNTNRPQTRKRQVVYHYFDESGGVTSISTLNEPARGNIMFRSFLWIVAQIVSRLNVIAAVSLRIMPVGDTLTVGSSKVPGAYRSKMFNALTDLGYDIDMVGSRRGGDTSLLPDIDHEGHKSFDISKMTDHIDEFLDAYDPDIILLMIGSQDIGNEYELDNMMKRWRRLVIKISSSRPLVHIFAANLPMRKDNRLTELIQTHFNSKLEKSIDFHSSQGRRISFVDVNSAITEDLLDTGVQPNQAGYDAIGMIFANSIPKVVKNDMSGLERGILRVRSTTNRRQVIVTFTKPIPISKSGTSNFRVDGLSILSSSIDVERRIVTLDTSLQEAARGYRLEVLSGVKGKSHEDFITGWRFLSLADWHLGEKYIFRKDQKLIRNDEALITHLKENYKGELVIMPGDTNAGFWDRESFVQQLSDHLGRSLSPIEAVLEAGNLCYSGLLSSFRFGGYSKVLVAIGDHEMGDNSWEIDSNKSLLQPQFREAFASNFNVDYDGNPKYSNYIGGVPPRPIGTVYENSSYAYIHNNLLIVTIDVLYQLSPSVEIGDHGTVTGDVNGEHLAWFESVLGEAKKNMDVKHIVVQGHFPVLFPVRKTKSSGMYMDHQEKSSFFEVMRRHSVDIYFAGECHLNSVIKDTDSGIVQIVGRGNFFSNFFAVDITDDTIDVTCYNEVGSKRTMYNHNYEQSGHLQILKQGGEKKFTSSGDLEFLDPSAPVVHFNFEEIVSLEDRPVLGLGEMPGVKRIPVVSEVEMGEIVCHSSLINTGTFGQDYDAQTANVALTGGVFGFGGEFGDNSRAAVFGMGPHSGGKIVTYAIWFKTQSYGNRILIAYEGYWNKNVVMTLRLRDGRPELVYSSSQKLKVVLKLNDGKWHHISATMPSEGCLLSEIKMYVDGTERSTSLVGDDINVNFPNGGVLSVGGFGYGNLGSKSNQQRTKFREGLPFHGAIDDVFVWARSLSSEEIKDLATVPTSFAIRTKLSYEWQEASCLGFGMFLEDVVLRSCNDNDSQQWIKDTLGFIHNKDRYDVCLIPRLGEIKVEKCTDSISSEFKWNLEANGLIQHENSQLYMTVNDPKNNAIELFPSEQTLRQLWDVVYEGGFAPSILTGAPTGAPTLLPSSSPSGAPSSLPSSQPFSVPSDPPSFTPTLLPSSLPTVSPSMSPSSVPSPRPTTKPTFRPLGSPSVLPSTRPSPKLTFYPSKSPSAIPTTQPSPKPTFYPSDSPSVILSTRPSPKLTFYPSKSPSVTPTTQPSPKPTFKPSDSPSISPNAPPSESPTSSPTTSPSFLPSYHPSPHPTDSPTEIPTYVPSICIDSSERIQMDGGKMKTCDGAKRNSNLCTRKRMRAHCPVTCGICLGDGTAAPTRAPTEIPTVKATDTPSKAPQGSCEDKPGKIRMPISGKMKSCWNAQNNPNLCFKNEIRAHCPATCGSCGTNNIGASSTTSAATTRQASSNIASFIIVTLFWLGF